MNDLEVDIECTRQYDETMEFVLQNDIDPIALIAVGAMLISQDDASEEDLNNARSVFNLWLTGQRVN